MLEHRGEPLSPTENIAQTRHRKSTEASWLCHRGGGITATCGTQCLGLHVERLALK